MPVSVTSTVHFRPGGTPVNPSPAALAVTAAQPQVTVNTASFTLGTTKPDASNTGYGVLGYTSGSLTDSTPASPGYLYNISADNTVVEGLRIHGRVVITGNNCTLRGCHIVGHLNMRYSSPYGLVNSSGTGNTIEYCEITCWDDSTSTDNSAGFDSGLDTYWPVGVYMSTGSCTVTRCDIHDANDTTYAVGGTHTIQGCYLHDPMFRNDDGDQSGASPAYWSHADGFQIMGGTNHMFDGNAIDWKFSDNTGMNRSGTGTVGSFGTGNPNPDPDVQQVWQNAHGILIQAHNAALSGVTIQRNWFRYGSVGIRFAANTFTAGAVTVISNRFTPDQGVEFSRYRQIAIDPATGAGGWSSTPPTIDTTPGSPTANVYSDDSDTPSGDQGTEINAFTGTSVQVSEYNGTAHTGHIPLSLTP